MKKLLAERHSSQADSQKSGGKSCGSFVELKAGGAEGEVQQKESHSSSSKSESSSSQASPNQSRVNRGSGEENLPKPPQYAISQKASLVNERENLHHRPSLSTTQLRHDRRQKEQVRHWPYHQWTNKDQGMAIAQDSPSKNFHQHQSKATSLSFLDRIAQWAKLSALLLGGTSLAAIILNYPLPSTYQQQPSATTTPLPLNPIPNVVPPSVLPQKELPPPETPSAKLPPLQEVPLPTPSTPSTLPESQNQTVSVSPSPAQIPSPTGTEQLSSPSPAGSVPVVPPSLPSMPPLTPPPCACPHQGAALLANPTGKADQDTRLNNNSQVAEVKKYLQQRWNPPSGLTQTLEYSLLLNRDGSIERIIPVGNAAIEYIDRTNIPSPGERFVSALQGETNSKIRVILTPNGKVQTSLEGKG